jgi:exopolysaccharide biosynthesis polyprenyl glycosylphosphotransferase
VQNRELQSNIVSTLAAVVLDGLALYGGFMLALWIRFDTGLFPVVPSKGIPTDEAMIRSSLVATGVFLLIFRTLKLYQRPHAGRFEDKIPRIVKAIGLGFILYLALEAALKLQPSYSRLALVVAAFTITFLVILERYIVYRIEWNLARHMTQINRVLIIGTDQVSWNLGEAIRNEPFFRSEVHGFLRTGDTAPHTKMSDELILGNFEDFERVFTDKRINEVIVADLDIGHARMVEIIVHCEKHFAGFRIVPDLFRILTSGVDIQDVNGIPLVSTARFPLDFFGKRVLKRGFDICFSLMALLLLALPLAILAILVKCSSPGPVFYRQVRMGENGREFNILKFRTMRQDAETGDKPGWTTPDDPRKTRLGSIMRKWNLDELPQFLNVLHGEMSVVGPRPERPYFVEQFKEEIDRYMKRHVYKPGITGWAQVHGLRGDTSIADRIRYDLYYLENWSLALDFKIILKTIFSHENAY